MAMRGHEEWDSHKRSGCSEGLDKGEASLEEKAMKAVLHRCCDVDRVR